MKSKLLALAIILMLAISSIAIVSNIKTTEALPTPTIPSMPSLVVNDTINRVNATLGIAALSQITAKGVIKNIGSTALTNLLTGIFFIEGTGVLVPADFAFDFSFDGLTWFPIHPSEVKIPTPAAAPMQVELVIGSPGGETLAPNATLTLYIRITLNSNMTPIGWPTNTIQSMIAWVYGDTNLNRQYDGGELIYSQPPAYAGLIDWDNPIKIDLAIVHTAEIAGTGKFYHSIQSAINAANPGDTIWVYPGTYNEALTVNKAASVVSIQGAAQTVIDGTGLVVPSGLVTINAPGDTELQGFTVQNAPQVGVARFGIFSKGPSGATYRILSNIIYGSNNSAETDDYGFYAQSGAENIIFRSNTIQRTASNPICFELHTGATEISGNTLETQVGAASDVVFFMTYNSRDVIALQNVSYNTFNMSKGTAIFDYAHRSAAISFNTPGAAWGLGDAKFTNVVIEKNTITDLKDNKRGIGFWNGGGGGGGAIAPLVKSNTITGTTGSIGSYGINFVGAGAAANANVMYNTISKTDWAVYLRTAGCASGIQIHCNTITGNNRGLDNALGSSEVDARFNWWGSSTGPFHPATNTAGLGNNVTNNVDYSPWLGKTVGSTPMIWHVNPTGTIQEAIDEAKSGDTIIVHSGTYTEALYITKSLTIQAASTPVIQGSQLFATNYGNREAVIFVENAQNVVLKELDIEGLGLGPVKSYAVLYENSSGIVYNCTVSPNTIGDMNSAAIAAWDNSVVTITGSTIKNFGRIGVYSNNAIMNIVGNTIIGQVYAADNLVNYGIEIEDYSGPSIATITQNVIYNCNNTHPNPSWSSAAIIVDTWREWADYYNLNLLPSKVSITYNTIYDNYESIEIVSNEFSYAHYNNFTNNAWGVWSAPENWTTNPTYHVFDARFNWWGDAGGPHHTTSWLYNGDPYGPHFGSGDEVSDYVLYDPWNGLPLPTLGVEPPLIEKQMVNTTFAVNITISNLREGYRAVGFQFRLCYDSALIEPVSVTEGAFMKDPTWNYHGTFFLSSIEDDPVYGPNVLVGILLLPNDTGTWEAFPYGNGTLATITFRTLVQDTGLEKPPLTCALTLVNAMIMNDDLEGISHNINHGTFKMYPTNAADINHDYKVDMKDIGIAAHAFGTVPGDPRWNPIADITGPVTWVPDGRVDMRDIGVIARNFGWRPLDDP